MKSHERQDATNHRRHNCWVNILFKLTSQNHQKPAQPSNTAHVRGQTSVEPRFCMNCWITHSCPGFHSCFLHGQVITPHFLLGMQLVIHAHVTRIIKSEPLLSAHNAWRWCHTRIHALHFTSPSTVCSLVHSGWQQISHQKPLIINYDWPFMPMDFPRKRPVMRKVFPCHQYQSSPLLAFCSGNSSVTPWIPHTRVWGTLGQWNSRVTGPLGRRVTSL